METATRNGSPQPPLAVPCQAAAPQTLPNPALPTQPVVLIPVRCLHSQDGTRLSRREAHIAELLADFQRRLREHPDQHPVHTPLRVIERGDRYPIVAGNYRYLAALRVPLEDLPCMILPDDLDDIHLFIEQHRDNKLHEGYALVEQARNILHVKEQLGCSQAEAGRQLGVENPSDTSKLLRVLKGIPEDLLEKIGDGDGKLPFTSAHKLAQLSDEGQIRDLAEKAIRGLLCRDRLVDAVNKLLGNGRKVKAKPVKARTPRGLQAIIPASDYECVLVELGVLVEAVRKAAEAQPAAVQSAESAERPVTGRR